MKILINGEQIDKKEKINIHNPYNNTIIDTVPQADKQDIEKIIQSAKQAQNIIKEMSSRKISKLLFRACHDLKRQENEFIKLLTLETGKPLSASKFEMDRSIETLQLAAEEAKRIYGETIPVDAGLGGKGFYAFTEKIPLGTVLAITPFNYPVNLAIHKIAPALAAKNTIILKPSTQAPLAALKLIEILDKHLPSGIVNSITGPGEVLGDLLVTHKDINKISFTGSVNTGLSISKKSEMKKLTLELGGNDPLLILKDADIEKAVKATINGAYLYSGQVCMAVKRIITEKPIADKFIKELKKQTAKLKIGNPLDEEVFIGPLINQKATEYVKKVVDSAINNGARLVYGGNYTDNLFEPTILDNVTSDMDIINNETFGPIAPIIRVNNLDEAIYEANNTEYGLQAGVFTENIHNALRCAREIEAGSVLINKQSTFRTDNMPFGGFKMSGMGKEGIKYAVEDMTRSKLIILNQR